MIIVMMDFSDRTAVITRKNGGLCTVFVGGTVPFPHKLFLAIDKFTSEFQDGYEHTDKYLNNEWDGMIHLFRRSQYSRHECYFPVGLTNRISDFLRLIDYSVVLVGFTKDQYNIDRKQVDFTIGGNIELRSYQINALEKINNCGGSGIVSLPAGSGKTIVAMEYIRRKGERTCVFVHRQELLYQWQRVLEERFKNAKITLVGAGHDDWTGDIVVAMVQMVSYHIKKYVSQGITKQFPLLVFDECHIMPAKTCYNISMKFSSIWRMGLSATPSRKSGDNIKLIGSVGDIVSNTTIEELVDQGWLARPEFIFLKPEHLPFRLRGNRYVTAYADGIVANEERNNMIATEANRLYLDGKQIYIHVNQIKHGKIILSDIIDRDVPDTDVRFITGISKNRKEEIDRFASGETRIMISTLLKEGVDIPAIDAIIYAAGGKSSISVIQTIGRAMRQTPSGSKTATIIDFIDWGSRYLTEHAIQRREIYREYYGELCP